MEMQWGVILTQLGGGLALFLYGMRRMTEALKAVAGSGMKNVLARLTTNRFTAALAGAFVTAVIQSSSVTTVLVVGFVSAGLLGLGQSIGVILGANVGTTVTAQIIAFQVYEYGLLLIAAGFFTEIAARRERVRQWGTAAMGLGLIFFGMELMSIATSPLREWAPFIELMQDMQNVGLAVLVGAVFTAIVQSSSATTGIVIVLASQGLITLETGIALVLGANVGTCVTAFVSAVGRPREAMQAAWVHIIFNVAGVLLWVLFIDQLADLVRAISPRSEGLAGVDLVAADAPRQLANAHTVFNLVNLALFIWFTGPLTRLVERIVPARAAPSEVRAKFLDDYFLSESAMALDLARRELVHLAGRVDTMLRDALRVTLHGSTRDVERLSRTDDDIDSLYGEIIRYLRKLAQRVLVGPQPQQLNVLVGIANYLENIGDVIEKDLLPIAAKRSRLNVVVTPATEAKLRALEAAVNDAFKKAVATIEGGGPEQAMDVLESKAIVAELAEEASAQLVHRLVTDEARRLESFQVESDIVEIYLRLNALTRRIARLTLNAAADPAKGDDA